ncbi:MAG: ATP phosphoribosyltransferase regulatory subunit [Cellulosilyticaceae bacterium]
MKNYTLHIPEGVKDFLWDEALAKDALQAGMKELFLKHHYNLIETPTFEYIDVFTTGEQSSQNPQLYKWINHQGEIVALRSDMTRAIARVVATQNSMRPFPQRYTYISNSFRYPERYQGKQHEFTQAGIELIGSVGSASDAEVIMLAIEALKEAGIQDFTIHIGSATFLREMLGELGATREEEQAIYKAIDGKDAVSLKTILSQLDHTGEVVDALMQLMQRSGTIDLVREVKGKLTSSVAREALTYLEDVYKLLVDFGVENFILFDFSILSYASYYTGIMFQGYTHGVGAAIVEGGRYDKLLAQFGKDMPAVGMGINIPFVLQKLQQKGESFKQMTTTLFVWDEKMGKVAIDIARQYRKEGLVVEYALTKEADEALLYAKEQGIEGMMYFRQDGTVVMSNVARGETQVVVVEDLRGN